MSLQHLQETASAATREQSVPLDELLRLEPQTGSRRERQSAGGPVSGAVVGTLIGFDGDGYPLVAFPGSPDDRGVPARSTVPIATADTGREVVLMFDQGEPSRPLVLGLLQPPQAVPTGGDEAGVTARLDGERLVLTAEREIELKCGKASIILTRAGKVLLRGAYVSSRSSGVNRIKGGVVHIN